MQNPFTFVGSYGVLDLGEGLYYMRSRTYDAMTQAFLSNDPLGIGVTANSREYATNNPVNWIDPDGRSSCQSGYSPDGVAASYQFSADQVGEPYAKKPYYTRRPERGQGSADSMKCVVTTLENVAGSQKSHGTAHSAAQITKKLIRGQYVDAAFDAASTGIGAVNPVAGAMTMFMGAKGVGDATLNPAQRRQMDNQRECNYHNRKEAVDFGNFTLPEFTLDF